MTAEQDERRTKDRIIRVLAREKPGLTLRYRVRSIALFGSYARGDQQPDSDVDILVDVDPAVGLGFVALAEHLEAALGLPVDLVSTRALKPRMREAVERDLIRV